MRAETFEDMMNDYKHGAYDFTKDGKCIQCGACCSRYLPLSQREIRQIKAYITKHNIKRQLHGVNVMAAPTLDHLCPFLDDTKPDHKCTIYEIRPIVCKEFICSWRGETSKKVFKEALVPTDMTDTFFPGQQKWSIKELESWLK